MASDKPQIHLTGPDGSSLGVNVGAGAPSWQRRRSGRLSAASPGLIRNLSSDGSEPEGQQQAPDLTVCDIIGDWGLYQWSLCLFALLWSAVASIPVVSGPLLTPDMAHVCQMDWPPSDGVPDDRRECFVEAQTKPMNATGDSGESLIFDEAQQLVAYKCSSFLYNKQHFGLTLTNGFDLVCDRLWLRSLVSSSALAGMLVSSVTLGLFSDRFGRLRCLQVAFVISCSATLASLFVRDYFLFCACVALMSYAQVGAANALCTLSMEALPPRFRYVPVFQYGLGWSLGCLLCPLLNVLTHDYRLFIGCLLAWQLCMLPWLHCGVHESIRWLLSEGHFNRAQIELRRACYMNSVQADTQIAKSIASIEAQQVRKASHIIEQAEAPRRLSQALGASLEDTQHELETLSSAIRKSFFGEPDLISEADARDPQARQTGQQQQPVHENQPDLAVLSPTLTRMSFSLASGPTGDDLSGPATGGQAVRPPNGGCVEPLRPRRSRASLSLVGADSSHRDSLTTQGLIQLAMKYSKTVEREDQGSCFIVQMFHRKLWRQTLLLLLVSVMFETSYFGLMQANKFVGESVSLNYVTGALCDMLAAFVTCFLLALTSRKLSLMSCTFVGAVVCLGMALSYQLIPDQQPRAGNLPNSSLAHWEASTTPFNGLLHLDGSELVVNTTNLEADLTILTGEQLGEIRETPEAISLNASGRTTDEHHLRGGAESLETAHERLVNLRHKINFWLMSVGKFVIACGIQVSATIAMEAYPNNLRQTGSGALVFAGRIGSICAPFLFNDPSPERQLFKATLLTLGIVGLVICCLVPVGVRDQKDRELCDRLNEIED